MQSEHLLLCWTFRTIEINVSIGRDDASGEGKEPFFRFYKVEPVVVVVVVVVVNC